MRALFWMGLGAGAMYLLDPDAGPRRRAQLQEKLTRLRQGAGEPRGTAEIGAMAPQKPAEVPAGAHHLGR